MTVPSLEVAGVRTLRSGPGNRDSGPPQTPASRALRGCPGVSGQESADQSSETQFTKSRVTAVSVAEVGLVVRGW